MSHHSVLPAVLDDLVWGAQSPLALLRPGHGFGLGSSVTTGSTKARPVRGVRDFGHHHVSIIPLHLLLLSHFEIWFPGLPPPLSLISTTYKWLKLITIILKSAQQMFKGSGMNADLLKPSNFSRNLRSFLFRKSTQPQQM